MSATPAGYEAFHSKRRKGVTLLCFLLASMMAMGITVYIDSYSVHEWDRNLDVGPVAAVASGLGIHNYVDQIRAVDGVTKAVALQSSYGNIEFTVNTTEGTYIQSEWGQFFAPTQEFLDTFPDYISIEEGSLPTTNSSQIAIIELVAMRRNLGIGDVLNFSEEGTYPPPKLVEVIGIYTLDLGESDTGY
ncbi:MAG: hypothetical protein ACFFCP_08730, partial [Promethearchaeota archaeon]